MDIVSPLDLGRVGHLSDSMPLATMNPLGADLLRLPAVALRLGPDLRELGVAIALKQLAA